MAGDLHLWCCLWQDCQWVFTTENQLWSNPCPIHVWFFGQVLVFITGMSQLSNTRKIKSMYLVIVSGYKILLSLELLVIRFCCCLRYQCGVARAFFDMSLKQDFYCDWTGLWKPNDQLKQCICKKKIGFKHFIV